MLKSEKKTPEELKQEKRQEAWGIWLKERQAKAVKENNPIQTVFRLTVAVDVVSDTIENAKESLRKMETAESFVFGYKGVRRLRGLFESSEEFKSISESKK